MKKMQILSVGLLMAGAAQAALVGEWTFDSQTLANTGTSGSTHDGTFMNSTGDAIYSTTTRSGSGYSIKLDSIADDQNTTGGEFLRINNSMSGDGSYASTFDGTAFTVSMWVSSTDGSWYAWDELGGKGNESNSAGWAVRSRNIASRNRGLYGSMYGATSVNDNTDTLADLNWHMVTMTYDEAATTLAVYYDGVLTTANTGAAAMNGAANYALVFGARDDGSRGENILIDSIQYYDTALSESEVAAMMIPEPASLGLVAVFGGGLLMVRRRCML